LHRFDTIQQCDGRTNGRAKHSDIARKNENKICKTLSKIRKRKLNTKWTGAV